MNAIVRAPDAIESASRSAVWRNAERRMPPPGGAASSESGSSLPVPGMTIGGSHSPKVTPPRGEPSSVTAVTGSPISRPAAAAGSLTVAEARMNTGVRSVASADAPQPADHLGDMRSEHAAVGVALVDHHEAKASPERGPRGVPVEQRVVNHVRIRQNQPAVGPDPLALLERRVAVQGGRANPANPRPPGRATGRPREPWSEPGIEPSAWPTRRVPSAPAIDRRATCRTRCRWKSPHWCRRGRGSRRQPDGTTAGRHPGSSARR